MELGYARASADRDDLGVQLDDLRGVGLLPALIYADQVTADRGTLPAFGALRSRVRSGDVVVVRSLDRLGRSVRETLDVLQEMTAGGVRVRNLADPFDVRAGGAGDPAGPAVLEVLDLVADMDRRYALERAARARTTAGARGRSPGRSPGVDPGALGRATAMRAAGATVAEIVDETGITRSTLYRYLPPRRAPGRGPARDGGPDATSRPPRQCR
jgi:DNA invertase Pin-like site-specific DNA recombinase